MTFWLSIGELELVVEALQARASRLESYGRAHPMTAGIHDRKAAAMRRLCIKLQRVGDAGVSRDKLSAKA